MPEQYKSILFNIGKILLLIIGILAGTLIAIRLVFFLAPFVLALVIANLVEPLIKLMVNRLKLNRRIAALISVVLIASTFGLLLTLLITKLVSEINSIYHNFPKYYATFSGDINSLITEADKLYKWLPDEVSQNIGGIVSGLSKPLTDLLNSIVSGAFATAFFLPQVLVFVLATILATYFFASDRHMLSELIKNQIPESFIDKFNSIKDDMFTALLGYVKAQLILMSITFTELTIGFFIINVKYYVLFALIISIIDALPILGTGGVLIPWAIYEFITGDFRTGIAILFLYAIVLIVRQLIEPKVLGQQIGVHPLLTLLAMYTGLQIFGVFGLIIGPVSVLLLKNILKGIFKNKSLKEFIMEPKNKVDTQQ